MTPLPKRLILCTSLLAAALAVSLPAQGGQSWVPLVPAGEGEAGEILIVNPNAAPVAVSIMAAGDFQQPILPLDLGGIDGDLIGAGATLRVPFTGSADEPLPGGAVLIASDSELLTFVELRGANGRTGCRARDNVRRTKNIVLPHLENRVDGSATCLVSVVNLDLVFNDQTDMITFTLVDPATGATISETTEMMPFPQQVVTKTGDDLGLDGTATLRISASRTILADALVRTASGQSYSTSGRDAAESGLFWYPFWRGASFDGDITFLGTAVSATYTGQSLLWDKKGNIFEGSPTNFSVPSDAEIVITGDTASGGDPLAQMAVLCEEIDTGTAPRAPQIRIERTGGDFAYLDPMRVIEPGEHGFCPVPGAERELHATSVLVVHATPAGDAVGLLRLRDENGRVLLNKRLVVRSGRHLSFPLKKLIGKRKSAVTAEIVNPLAPAKAGKTVGGGNFQGAVIVSSEKVGSKKAKGTGDQLSVLPFLPGANDEVTPTIVAPEFTKASDPKRGVLVLDGRVANIGKKALLRVRNVGSDVVLGEWKVRGRSTIKLKLKSVSQDTKAGLGDVWPFGEERDIQLVDEAANKVSVRVAVRRGEIEAPPEE